MKRVTPKQYAIALYESIKDSEGTELNQRIRNFLELIRKRKNMKSLNKIYKHFVAVYQEREQVLQAEVTASRDLGSKVKSEIIHWLNESTGRTATLTELIDPTILGGVIVKFGDTVWDASLKNSLKKLQNSFNK
ncbi:MAG: ATP synthase F1 subunit delta [Candidatus Kerfeldbacteria bacterium CG_4_10_14_0_8_um_filter_42_10]|uniref:ATP synthase subunit delta n=1 Tax=Candidatus Kerfeldbacteria bacterium CG_4_10_14_0_8_um_filter_42_10 TaxID=2014248 RepID=A0A2M7RK42_9BACT|nr:MAG: ATP synthase F1 subunit delta [Candidatus Kerfeldbacteria bacterium CG_4_10_14_0_8_um_filter_42_10]